MKFFTTNFECMKYLKGFLALLLILSFQWSTLRAANVAKSYSLVEALLHKSTNLNKFNGSVSGQVVEDATNDILIGANVVIKGTLKGTSVDVEGNFSIRNVEAGPQILVVSYLGFETKEIPVEIVEGENLTIKIRMKPQGIMGEEVTITAQAKGQVAAINQQRSSNTISNIVAKDRIEELPDVNAAESIGRLPGVSLQRSGGEANKVVIRGLSPKYNTVTVNGVRLPSTDSQNRSVDLSLVSSNMLDGIEVTKAITPDKDADAIGGTIDLRIRNASAGWSGDFQAQGGYTALQNTYNNYKFVGSVGNRFFDNKLGVILNLNTDSYDRSADLLNASYGEKSVNSDVLIFPNFLNLRENSLTRSRVGGSFIADYEIPEGKIVFNSILNRLTNDGFARGNELDYNRRIHKYSLNENYNESQISAYGLSLEQDFGWISYDFGVSYTSSTSKSPNDYYSDFMEESAAISSNEEDTLKPQDLPALFRNDIDQTGLLSLSETWRKTAESEKGAQLNIKIPFDLNSSINGYVKFGGKVRMLERSNDQNQQSVSAYYGGGRAFREDIADGLPGLNLDPTAKRFYLTSFQGNYVSKDFLSGNHPLGYSINPALMRRINTIAKENEHMTFSRNGSLGQDYEGKEDFQALYAMTELEIGRYITFMPGVRWESEATDYSAKFSTAIEPAAGTLLNEISFRDTTTIRDNSFLLPMIHVQVKPNNWINLRLAYTQTISRPDFRQFAPITYFNAISNYANAPNQNLKSSKSTNYDASLSIYNNKLGFFTASLFYKNIEDLIWGITFQNIEGQQILPDLEIIEANGKAIQVNTVINNPFDATIKGIELDWQARFWYLPSFLKGLVLNVNYTHIISDTKIPSFRVVKIPLDPPPRSDPFFELALVDTAIARTLPDQPNDILNLTIGYDYKGFSTRFSVFYQLGSTLGTGSIRGTYDDTFKEDYFRLDVSASQKLPYNFQLFANLNNLNGAGDENYQSPVYRYPTNQQFYGFTMDVGVRYKFQ